TGTDTITYVIEDNGVSDIPGTLQEVSRPLQAIGEITFNIVDANQGPSAFDDTVTVVAGSPRSIAVLENDFDDDPTTTLVITQFGQGDQGGTVTQDGDQLVYTPAAGFVGTETFTYTVSDGDLADTGLVTVTVSDEVNATNSAFKGSVFFDGNNDGEMGAGEQGIGGVVINLTGLDIAGNAVERQTTTAIDGSYAFETLPMGTFEITQEQPRFLLDGIDVADASSTSNGDDSFTITVGEDEIQSDANMFAERGLSLQFAALDAMSSRRGSGFLTAVSNGESQFIRNPIGWDDFSDIRVTMSEDELQVVVSAVDKDSQTVQATFDARDRALVQLYGRDGDTLLMRIVAGADDLNLQ
ncbi:MAG: Ig-like domain-containing protein, partial [Planctomycetota bacterium]